MDDYKESLKEINSLLRKFEGLVDDIIIKTPEGVYKDHKTELKNSLDSFRKLVSNHAVNINTKAAELRQLLPLSTVEQKKLTMRKPEMNLLRWLN